MECHPFRHQVMSKTNLCIEFILQAMPQMNDSIDRHPLILQAMSKMTYASNATIKQFRVMSEMNGEIECCLQRHRVQCFSCVITLTM